MHDAYPAVADLVMVGGGHAHALALARWTMRPAPGVRVTLVTPTPRAGYSGMLPGRIAGLYKHDEVMADLAPLAAAAGARIILAEAVGVDRRLKRVRLAGRPDIAYDALSLNVGCHTPLLPVLAGAEAPPQALAVKPLDPFLEGLDAFAAKPESAEAAVVVVGGGVGGCELALALRRRLGPGASLTLVERGAAVGRELPNKPRAALEAALRQADVRIETDAAAEGLADGALALLDGRRLAAELVISCAGAVPPPLLAQTGLARDDRGFIRVGPTLQSISDPAVFACGDAAALEPEAAPKAGVYSVRQGPILCENLARRLQGRPLRRYRPQQDFLRLISLGDARALAARRLAPRLLGASAPVFSGRGAALWRLKDRIDRAFMDKLKPRPPKPAPALAPPAAAQGLSAELARDPLCGACGAKVGFGALDGAMAALSPAARRMLPEGMGDDAALLTLAPGAAPGLVSIDQLRGFTEDYFLLARIAVFHAFGDIWASGAEPAGALMAVTLGPQSAALQEEALRQALEGAASACAEADAPLLGGHSAAGAETSVTVAAAGRLMSGGRAIPQGGARAGDALILTKPLGVGAILAAHMRAQAPGPALAAALAAMNRPIASEAAVLARAGAGAMTDVTGFGLLGHLRRLAAASGVDAELLLSAAPMLPGAEALAAAGVQSSLAPANRAALFGALSGGGTDDPREALLYDPQTAGGLLAALPAEAAASAIEDLESAGIDARIIGRLIEPRQGGGAIALDAAPL